MKQVLLMIAVVALVGCGKPLIDDPIVEKAVRKSLRKPTGKLTKADLEKVTSLYLSARGAAIAKKLTDVKGLENLTQLKTLYLNDNQLTSVKGLEKLTKLEVLYLYKNPDLTKAQIDELKKALPKCVIASNPTNKGYEESK